MVDPTLRDDLLAQLDHLAPQLQRRVLDFAKSLQLKGVEGKSLLRFAGTIPADDLELMAKAIEESCETVDDEW